MDEALIQLRREIAGRYEVEQELGHGGMAVVYLAKDLRHDRRVAIKVLRQDVGGASAERFLREIRTVAQLHHPHILQLLDSGTAGDHLFYVMPYVEGETIRERLEREGPFPIEEAVRIAREVADALAFAHGRGIVHRDIKPENIFLSAGHALVADFGIARSATAAVGATTLTDVGLAVGTPSYMSPEQATADPKVDGRSDQYALGCVLYEMLAGAPPFTGPTSQAIMARHTADPVPPLRTVRDVPANIESAVNRALAKVPADRWPDVRALAEALTATVNSPGFPRRRFKRSTMIAGALVIAAVAAAAWPLLKGDSAAATPAESVRRIGVVPFSWSGDDSVYQLVADGLSEGVITALSKVDTSLSVVAGSLIANARTITSDDRELGKRVGADAILTARILGRGNTFRIVPQLVEVATGRVLWSETLDGELEVDGKLQDLWLMQDTMSVRIVSALQPRLSLSKRNLAARGTRTTNPEAFRLVQQARASWNDPHLQEKLLRQAIALDSLYADAWADLADAIDNVRVIDGTPSIDAAPEVRRIIDRAIELDSTNARAFELRGRVHWFYDWNWESADQDMKRAVVLAPGLSTPIVQYTWLLHFMNMGDSALALARRQVALDSLNAESQENLAYRFLFAGMLDSAIAVGLKAQRLDSNRAAEPLMRAYLRKGLRVEALQMVDRPFHALERALLQNYYWASVGDSLRAREARDRSIALAPDLPQASVVANFLAGSRETAIRALVRASAERQRALPGVLAQVYWQLKDDPRVEQVRRRVYGDRFPPPDPWVGRSK